MIVLPTDAGPVREAAAPAPRGPTADSRSDTAGAFEAMVLRPMVETMLPAGAAFGTGTGSDAWRGMLVDALADTLAREGTLGLDGLLPGDARP